MAVAVLGVDSRANYQYEIPNIVVTGVGHLIFASQLQQDEEIS